MVRVEANTSVNLVDPEVWYGDVYEATDDQYIISDGFRTAVWEGRNLSYNGSLQVTGGIFDSLVEYRGGIFSYEMLGLNASAAYTGYLLANNDMSGFYDWVLSGNDQIYGSNYADRLAGYDGHDDIFAGAGDYVLGGAGNDIVYLGAGSSYVNGGSGLDFVDLPGQGSAFTLQQFGSEWDVNGAGVNTTTAGVERFSFDNGTLAVDIEGTAGQAYRIYQAAFAREPDIGGLSYWIESMDAGTSLYRVGQGFVASAEFQQIYGSNVPNDTFVARLYHNILGRDGEPGGLAYWTEELDSGRSNKAEVLIGFSESPENKSGVDLSDGVWYV